MPTPLLESLIKKHGRKDKPGDYVLTAKGVAERDRKDAEKADRGAGLIRRIFNNEREVKRPQSRMSDEQKKRLFKGRDATRMRTTGILSGLNIGKKDAENYADPGGMSKQKNYTPKDKYKGYDLKEILKKPIRPVNKKNRPKGTELLDKNLGGNDKSVFTPEVGKTAASMALGGLEALSRRRKAEHEDKLAQYQARLNTQSRMSRALSNLANIGSGIGL